MSELDQAPEAPFWTYGDLALFLLTAIPCFLCGFFIIYAAMEYGPVHFTTRGIRVLLPQFTGYALMLVPLVLIFGKYGRPLWRSLGWRITPGEVAPAILLGVATSVLVLLLGALLRTPQSDNAFEDLLKDPVSITLVAIFGSTFGPAFEEIVFRGLVQPLLVRSLGVATGILLAALPFALMHGPQYRWSWQHVVLICLAGSAFGWKRHVSGSVAVATVMHGAYNLLQIGGYLIGRNFV
jgi:membrane protease YdiL (CAAX protease family)